ncbi:hypothetical protein ABTX34_14615 [Streptomyces sp. NPDC096538]|uniref:hypothetical protein n=1 Tax=Streptomyces sp. NPDC096538 TaxID=3155427 RepID=UPI0033196EDE
MTAARYDVIAIAQDLPGPPPRPVLARLLGLFSDDSAAVQIIRGGFSRWWGGRLSIVPGDTELVLGTSPTQICAAA